MKWLASLQPIPSQRERGERVSVHLGIWLTYHTLAGQNTHHRDLESLRLVTQHVSSYKNKYSQTGHTYKYTNTLS